jgi:hypothetical protein
MNVFAGGFERALCLVPGCILHASVCIVGLSINYPDWGHNRGQWASNGRTCPAPPLAHGRSHVRLIGVGGATEADEGTTWHVTIVLWAVSVVENV